MGIIYIRKHFTYRCPTHVMLVRHKSIYISGMNQLSTECMLMGHGQFGTIGFVKIYYITLCFK